MIRAGVVFNVLYIVLGLAGFGFIAVKAANRPEPVTVIDAVAARDLRAGDVLETGDLSVASGGTFVLRRDVAAGEALKANVLYKIDGALGRDEGFAIVPLSPEGIERMFFGSFGAEDIALCTGDAMVLDKVEPVYTHCVHQEQRCSAVMILNDAQMRAIEEAEVPAVLSASPCS